MNIKGLRSIHTGRCAVILGGGPSLPRQIKNIPPDAVIFGVNGHASRIIDCDYIVFNDEHGQKLFKDIKGKKISRFQSDIYQDCSPGLISGIVALRAAQTMGCSPIILMGFDCYQGDAYFHDKSINKRGRSIPLTEHIRYWQNENTHEVFVAGGPLRKVFQMTKKIKIKSKYIKVQIFEQKSVDLDDRRSVTFIPGEFTLTRELAEAAVRHKCGKLIKH